MKELWRAWVTGPALTGRVQMLRSLIVGGVATVVDMLLFALIFTGLQWNEMLAATLGFCAGLLVNFALTRMWVFTEGSRMNGAAEFGAFAAISVIGLGLTVLIVWAFGNPLAERGLLGPFSAEIYVYIGRAVSIVTVFFWNFLMRKYVIYRK